MGHIISRINYRYKLAKKRAETAEKLAKEFEAAQMQCQETDCKTGEPYPKEQQGMWHGEITGDPGHGAGEHPEHHPGLQS